MFENKCINGAWYPVAFSSDCDKQPLPVQLFDEAWVVFRTSDGRYGALEDRCPHRNVPLSKGEVCGDLLQCAYHGWSFNHDGECARIPGLTQSSMLSRIRVPSRRVVNSGGTIFMQIGDDRERWPTPPDIACANDAAYRVIRERVEFNAPLDAVAENALDVPHTAFLHRSLFRTAEQPLRLDVIVRRNEEQVEAEFVGEKAPSGWLGKLVIGGNDPLQHWDRFLAPCIAQVEYRMGQRAHLVATAALCPRSAEQTSMLATVAFRFPGPNVLVELIAKPIAMRVVRQDVDILEAQTKNITRFGGERFRSTPIDFIGPAIRSILQSQMAGETAEISEERVAIEF